MSPGKVAAQVAHVQRKISDRHRQDIRYWNWVQEDEKKIILQGKQKDLERLIELDFYFIKDNGLTEIPAGSLTVVGLPPMPRSEAQRYVKKLQLY